MMINGRYVTPKLSLIFRAFPAFRFTCQEREKEKAATLRAHFHALGAATPKLFLRVEGNVLIF